jgi:hypothetical protein
VCVHILVSTGGSLLQKKTSFPPFVSTPLHSFLTFQREGGRGWTGRDRREEREKRERERREKREREVKEEKERGERRERREEREEREVQGKRRKERQRFDGLRWRERRKGGRT